MTQNLSTYGHESSGPEISSLESMINELRKTNETLRKLSRRVDKSHKMIHANTPAELERQAEHDYYCNLMM